MPTLEHFYKIRPTLIEALAHAIEEKLKEMGPRAKGISWFSSTAAEHPENKQA